MPARHGARVRHHARQLVPQLGPHVPAPRRSDGAVAVPAQVEEEVEGDALLDFDVVEAARVRVPLRVEALELQEERGRCWVAQEADALAGRLGVAVVAGEVVEGLDEGGVEAGAEGVGGEVDGEVRLGGFGAGVDGGAGHALPAGEGAGVEQGADAAALVPGRGEVVEEEGDGVHGVLLGGARGPGGGQGGVGVVAEGVVEGAEGRGGVCGGPEARREVGEGTGEAAGLLPVVLGAVESRLWVYG